MESHHRDPESIRLSKSRFVSGLQCLKRLYLSVHQPELAGEPDEQQTSRFTQGNEVGLLAQRRFREGVTVGFEQGAAAALTETAALLQNPSVGAIFEGAFLHRNTLVRVDVLERRRGNRWRLIEVKSSLDLKAHYLQDLAIQYHVLKNCGLDMTSACLMHLNRDYRYNGHQYHVAELFTIRNLTRQVQRIAAGLAALLIEQFKMLAVTTAPEISPGPQCTEPNVCEFFHHCNTELPEHHINSLPHLSAKKRLAFGELGVNLIEDIPEDFKLSELQDRVRTAVRTGQAWISPSLGKELARLKAPLYFMDFESIYPAIPRHAGMRPYAQIPFQWSVHRRLETNGELEHAEYLADDDRDPRLDFIRSLCEAVGTRGKIVVYNASFESTRLRDLAEWLPAYRDRIEKIRARLWDLLPFVKLHVYHPQFQGSFSIKTVLPALTGMTYDGMEVSQGDEAGVAWERMVGGGVGTAERIRIRDALLAYCGQDTVAMLRVLEQLNVLSTPISVTV